MEKKIIDGYNGIMPLDLTNIDPKYHKDMIAVHMQDIKTYKKEQKERKPELRYENCVLRVEKQLAKEKYLENLRRKEEIIEQKKKDLLHIKLYTK